MITFSFLDNYDEVAHWWTAVVDVASHWLLGEESLDDIYKKVENIPESLLCLEDPLPKAIFAVYVARKNYITVGATIPQKKILKQCDHASQLLMDSLTYSSCKPQDNLVLVSLLLDHFRYSSVSYGLRCIVVALHVIL